MDYEKEIRLLKEKNTKLEQYLQLMVDGQNAKYGSINRQIDRINQRLDNLEKKK